MAGVLGVVGEGLVELGMDTGSPRGDLRCGFGGDAPNAAVMASRAGARARICSRVGDDAMGRRLLAFWREAGVDVGCVAVDRDAATGLYVNERDADGRHRFDYHRARSSGSRLSVADVTDAFLDGLAVLHYTGVTLAISAAAAATASVAARRARSAGARISFAVNHRPALAPDAAALRTAARDADILFVSEEDAAGVFGTADEAELLGLLGGGDREIVLTHGSRGACVHHAGGTGRVAAVAVTMVDAAGAGDALAGAYIAGRIAAADPVTALRRGVIAASLSCTATGCALSYPDAAAVAAAGGAAPPRGGRARD